jgi:hypothetical protein
MVVARQKMLGGTTPATVDAVANLHAEDSQLCFEGGVHTASFTPTTSSRRWPGAWGAAPGSQAGWALDGVDEGPHGVYSE